MNAVVMLISQVLRRIIGFLFLIMICSGLFQVFTRYVLKLPLMGNEEFTRAVGVWLTFLGSAVATRERSHITVDLIYSRLKPRARRISDWIINLSLFVINGLLLIQGIRLIQKYHFVVMPATRWPMSILYAAITAGAFFSCLYVILDLVFAPKPVKVE